MGSDYYLKKGVLYIVVGADETPDGLKQKVGRYNLGREVKKIAIDFSNIKFLSSAYLAALISIYKRGVPDVEVYVAGVDKALFKMTRLDKVIKLVESIEEVS